MAVVAERPVAPALYATAVADPAPLGLAAFALTTFLLSGHNASFIPDVVWLGAALFYVILAGTTKLGAGLHGTDVPNGLAWFVMGFAFFNLYMLLWSLRINVATFFV